MRAVKLLGLAVMAVLSLGAVASSVASAEELPNVLPLATVAEPITFTTSSGVSRLILASGREIVCSTSTGSGEVTVAAGGMGGNFAKLFEGCKDEATNATCTGLGQAAGHIQVKGTWDSRYTLDTPAKTVAAFFPEHVHFTCGATALYLVLGCVAGIVEPINTLTSEVKVLFKATGTPALQEIMLVDTLNGSGMEDCLLKVKKGSEPTEEEATLIHHQVWTNFKKGIVPTEVLIMA